jgi:hypothetical protein
MNILKLLVGMWICCALIGCGSNDEEDPAAGDGFSMSEEMDADTKDDASSDGTADTTDGDKGGEKDETPAKPAAVPRIGGKWTGSFFVTDKAGSTPLKATIRQSNDAIVITTNLAEPPGQMFSGGITTSGKMTLTDAFDGEIWTTFFGPATTDFVKIADFVERPQTNSVAPPLFVIELRR